MVQNPERVIPGCITSKHIVQLFDTTDTLADGVSMFLYEGFHANESLVVVARGRHWKSIAARLERRGCAIAAAVAAGRLTVCDAARTLSQFMRNGRPVATLFRKAVGSMVERLAPPDGSPLWIYGEMVDILAEERNFAAVRHLEEHWNELALRQSFTLLCGYSSAHFAEPASARSLADICGLHTHVQTGSDDLMGSWVLKRRAADPAESSQNGNGPAKV